MRLHVGESFNHRVVVLSGTETPPAGTIAYKQRVTGTGSYGMRFVAIVLAHRE